MKPYREREPEPDAERRYVDATFAGDFALARALFEQIPLPEHLLPIDPSALPRTGRVLAVRNRVSKLGRLLQRWAGVEALGAWLVELDGRPVLCGFDEWIVIDRSATQEERELLQRVGIL